jgi:hypothetical protein
MGRGLSARQRRLLALLVVSKRPIDVTGEAAVILGDPDTRSARVSLLDSVRSLERRGLVTVERTPDPRGGWGRVVVAARDDPLGDLGGGELHHRRRDRP